MRKRENEWENTASWVERKQWEVQKWWLYYKGDIFVLAEKTLAGILAFCYLTGIVIVLFFLVFGGSL